MRAILICESKCKGSLMLSFIWQMDRKILRAYLSLLLLY